MLSFSKMQNKYKKDNRLISNLSVAKTERSLITQSNYRIEALTDDLIANRISLAKWEKSLAEELKTLHVQRALLARGGRKASTQDDWLSIGRILREEYKYVHEMALDIQSGEVTEAGLKARLKLYTERSSLSGHFMKKENAMDSGYKYMKRILGSTDHHCQECLVYASLGVLPIGQLPLPTVSCTCMANCKCSVVYS